MCLSNSHYISVHYISVPRWENLFFVGQITSFVVVTERCEALSVERLKGCEFATGRWCSRLENLSIFSLLDEGQVVFNQLF